jgi:hypothetical protein
MSPSIPMAWVVISQIKGQLGQTVPPAMSRLQAIADIGAFGVSPGGHGHREQVPENLI